MVQPANADGWTLFSEALRLVGRESDAALADGFGGALTASQAATPIIRPDDVGAPDAYRFPELPAGLLPVTDKNMPRLATPSIARVLSPPKPLTNSTSPAPRSSIR